MILFQKFHPTGLGEAAKLGNKVLHEYGSDAASEIPDKVLKPRPTPMKFVQPVRPTKPLLMIECVGSFNFTFCDKRTFVCEKK